MAGKSPEFLKETPDFGGLLGQRGCNAQEVYSMAIITAALA